MPNKHHFLVDLSPFDVENKNEVFHADDRPYGYIEGAVRHDDAPDPVPRPRIALRGCLIGPSPWRRSEKGLTCASDVDGLGTSARTTHGCGPNPGPAGGRAGVH